MKHVSGFVTIIGLPNVGKSTFLNSLLGQKIAIVSDKPQTTRNIISGIYTQEDCQIIFIDTPGVHKPKHELGKRMTDSAFQATLGVDVILFMIAADKPFGPGEQLILEKLKNQKKPVCLLINKIDLFKSRVEIDKVILAHKDLMDFAGIFPISALEQKNIEYLLNELKKILPEGPKYYPETQITDHPERFIIAELIREKILRFTREEVPHSVAVVVESLRPSIENAEVLDCHCTVYVERKSQKGILIGEQGQMMKKISTQARKDIQRLLGSKVYLEIWVKVKEDWRNKSASLRALGYGIDNF